MKIFITALDYVDIEDLKLMKTGGTVYVPSSTDSHFSSLDKALAYLTEEIKGLFDDESVLRATVKEVELDNQEADYILHIYDKDLKYIEILDFDQVTEKSIYKKGDWVLFIQGSTLTCGLVDAPPEGSEAGLIIYENSNLKDCSPHDHTKEINIMSKVSEDKAQELLPRKYFEGIKRRYREHNPEKKDV